MKIRRAKNLYTYLLSFGASFVGIALNFFLARVLKADDYGQIQYLLALSTTIAQILIFGINAFLIREAKNEKQNGSVINKCFSLYLVIVIFFVPIVYFVLNSFVSVTSGNAFVTFLVLVVAILMGLNMIITAYFQGRGKYHLSLIFENLLPKILMFSVAVIFLVIGNMLGFKERYLIFYIAIYSLIAVPFTIKYFRCLNFNFSKSELSSIFFFFGVTITYSLGNNLTKVLQGSLYHNNIALGIISVSISIISLVKVFTSVLDNLVKPIFAKKSRDKDYVGLINIYRFETRMNCYVAIPLYLFFIFNPIYFLSVFGETYTIYPQILSIIALANAVADITGSNGALLAMTGKEKWELFNGFLYFAVYFASIFIFSFDKIYGLTYGLLAAQICVNIAKYVEVWLLYKTNPLNSRTLLTLGITILTNALAIYLIGFIHINYIFWLCIGAATGVVLVLINVFVTSLYRKTDFKELLNLRL